MKLLELNPTFRGEILHFDCPKCGTHRVDIPLVGNKNFKRTWSMYGTREHIELRPSIRLDCCTFNVVDGEVRLVP